MQFNSKHWYLTLPKDASGGNTKEAKMVKPLGTFRDPKWFYDNPDGSTTFHAEVDGATTSGSKYARSELRELDDKGNLAGWTTDTGGLMTARLKVDAVPTKLDGKQGKVVIGQIHGPDDELVRLYWDAGQVYFVDDKVGSLKKEKEKIFTLKNSFGDIAKVPLGTFFDYSIQIIGMKRIVIVRINGVEFSSVTTISPFWKGKKLYFKAGVYLGQNETTGTGAGTVTFSYVSKAH